MEAWLQDPAWDDLGPDEPPSADAVWHDGIGAWHEIEDYLEIEWTEVDGADAYALYVDENLQWATTDTRYSGPRERLPRTGQFTVRALVWAEDSSLGQADDELLPDDAEALSEPSTLVPLPEE